MRSSHFVVSSKEIYQTFLNLPILGTYTSFLKYSPNRFSPKKLFFVKFFSLETTILDTLNKSSKSSTWADTWTNVWAQSVDRCLSVALIRYNPRFVRGIARFRRIKRRRARARPDDKRESKRFGLLQDREKSMTRGGEALINREARSLVN